MKHWTIDEFLAECEELCRNEYTYDYSRMPEGFCNGHEVCAYERSWHSIVVDNRICNMARIDDSHPDGDVTYSVRNKSMTALEYVRYILEQPVAVKVTDRTPDRRLFQYHGTLSVMSHDPKTPKVLDIVLHDMERPDKSPMRIEAYGALAKYIYEIQMTDAEERYIASNWCYDENLTLHRIEVPSREAGEVAKIITSLDTISDELVVFGPQEYIESPEPRTMSQDQFYAWLRWRNGERSATTNPEPEPEDDELDL